MLNKAQVITVYKIRTVLFFGQVFFVFVLFFYVMWFTTKRLGKHISCVCTFRKVHLLTLNMKYSNLAISTIFCML